MCGALVLRTSQSGFHAWLTRSPSARASADAMLTERIRASFPLSDRTYGARRVVGWSMKNAMTADLVTDALVMAIRRRGKPDELLHPSDHGSQHTSEQFQRLMADHGITCSMSRSGNVWDNAAVESFFSTLKSERSARKIYRTRDQPRADVFDDIERFCNPRRRHSTLDYMSPMAGEKRAMGA